MKEKHNRECWKINGIEKKAYIAGRVGIYGEQALIPGMMNTFLIFNGISLASVAIFTLIVKIIDAIDDLLFGFLVDKIDIQKNKLLRRIGGDGRYMPWLRCFIWFFPMIVIAFFIMPSGLSETGKLAWFLITYLFYDFTYTIVDVPTQSLTITITDIPEERNHILTVGMVIISAVMCVMSIVQTLLISENVGMPISTVGILLAVIYMVPMLPFVVKVKEHNSEMKNASAEKDKATYTIKEMCSAVRNNKPYMVLELSGLLRGITSTGSAVSLFVSFYLYSSSTAMVVPGMVALVLGIIIEMLAPRICKRFGNKATAVATSFVSGVLGLGMYFTGWNNFGIVALYSVTLGVIGALLTMSSTYMMLQTIDYGKYVNNRDTTGIFNSINTFLAKVAPSIASSLGLIVLDRFGWVTVNAESFADLAAQNITQPNSAHTGLWVLTVLIPAVGMLLSALLMLIFYRLREKDAELMGKCVAGEINREECEMQLTTN